jgi:hypothetical protein
MKRNDEPGKRSEQEREASTARERTLAHLENLMHTATTVGAGIVLACSARAQGQRPPQVCDPLPPPVGCCENPEQFLLRGCLDHQTRWLKSGAVWTLELGLWLHVMPGRDRISFEVLRRDEIRVAGAVIKDLRKETYKVELVFAPVAGRKQINVELAVQCNGKRIPLKLNLDLSKPPEMNRSVPVSLGK